MGGIGTADQFGPFARGPVTLRAWVETSVPTVLLDHHHAGDKQQDDQSILRLIFADWVARSVSEGSALTLAYASGSHAGGYEGLEADQPRDQAEQVNHEH